MKSIPVCNERVNENHQQFTETAKPNAASRRAVKWNGKISTPEEDRGAYVLAVIRAAKKDAEATLKKIVGSPQAAKVLRWALYWSGKSTYCPGDTFLKTRPEWGEEAGVTESSLKTAVKHLRRFPWWRDACHLQPNGRRAQHYTVNIEAVLDEVLKVLEESQPRLRLVKALQSQQRGPRNLRNSGG